MSSWQRKDYIISLELLLILLYFILIYTGGDNPNNLFMRRIIFMPKTRIKDLRYNYTYLN